MLVTRMKWFVPNLNFFCSIVVRILVAAGLLFLAKEL